MSQQPPGGFEPDLPIVTHDRTSDVAENSRLSCRPEIPDKVANWSSERGSARWDSIRATASRTGWHEVPTRSISPAVAVRPTA